MADVIDAAAEGEVFEGRNPWVLIAEGLVDDESMDTWNLEQQASSSSFVKIEVQTLKDWLYDALVSRLPPDVYSHEFLSGIVRKLLEKDGQHARQIVRLYANLDEMAKRGCTPPLAARGVLETNPMSTIATLVGMAVRNTNAGWVEPLRHVRPSMFGDLPHVPRGELSVPDQPKQIKTNLFRWQLRSLGWLTAIEKQIETEEGGGGWQIPSCAKTVLLKEGGRVLSDQVAFEVSGANETQVLYGGKRHLVDRFLKSTGMIVADEMGLGKSLLLIALIYASYDAERKAQVVPRSLQAVVERPWMDTQATLIVVPSLILKQWQKQHTEHLDAKVVKPRIVQISTIREHAAVTLRHVLQAHVILVSASFLENAAYLALGGGGSIEDEKESGDSNSKFDFAGRMRRLEHAYIEQQSRCMKDGNYERLLKHQGPPLEWFNFRRIIVDEGHMIMSGEVKFDKSGSGAWRVVRDKNYDILCGLRARSRIYVSGTPFTAGINSVRGCMNFLRCTLNGETIVRTEGQNQKDLLDTEAGMAILGTLHEHLYARHTKATIDPSDFQVPDLIEEVQLLDMSDVERGMYQALYEKYRAAYEVAQAKDQDPGVQSLLLQLRQQCAHAQISSAAQDVLGSGAKSLDEIRECLMGDIQKRLDERHRRVRKLQADERDRRREAAGAESNVARNQLKDRAETCVRQAADTRLEIASLERELRYFQSIQAPVKPDDTCPLCLEEFSGIDHYHLTPCGHMFCEPCGKNLYENSKDRWSNESVLPVCPHCRASLPPYGKLNVVSNKVGHVAEADEEKKVSTVSSQMGPVPPKLVSAHGTKMAFLIHWISHLRANDPTRKFIIFSQWDYLLKRVGESLTQCKIKWVTCAGNVYVRTAAIESFKKQADVSVILLSLEKAGAGADLTEATNVVLLDRAGGTKQEADAIEEQAIRRAYRQGQKNRVTVTRLIMKDTVEHQLYSQRLAYEQDESKKAGMQVPLDPRTKFVRFGVQKQPEKPKGLTKAVIPDLAVGTSKMTKRRMRLQAAEAKAKAEQEARIKAKKASKNGAAIGGVDGDKLKDRVDEFLFMPQSHWTLHKYDPIPEVAFEPEPLFNYSMQQALEQGYNFSVSIV